MQWLSTNSDRGLSTNSNRGTNTNARTTLQGDTVVVESQVLRLGLRNPNYEIVAWVERNGKVF